MLQLVVVNVSVDGPTVPSPVSELATPISTSPVGSVASFTVNVAVPPDSVVSSREPVDVAGDTASPAVSSSVSVSATPPPDTVPTPWPLASTAVTVTCRSAASTSLSTAASAAPSALDVAPATITIRDAAPEPTEYAPAAACTVTVVACAERRLSVAVTVATPPFSEIDEDDSASVASGAASSSVMVSARATGCCTLWSLTAAPETVACLFGASVSSSTAATVTVPLLVVAPAAMVSVAGLDSA